MKKMKLFLLFLGVLIFSLELSAQDILPVRGLCIGIPNPAGVDNFIRFVDEELPARKINLLVVRVDYSFRFRSHPEMGDSTSLSDRDVKRLVDVCRKHNIRLIPLINLLGHQSWASTPTKLLKVYPKFDETPQIPFPEKYVWPNADSLYCKSYCPLHPDLHPLLFDLIDEVCDAFGSDGFHAGMDEVFYLGHAQCPRCAGKDKAKLFADEVNLINRHVKEKGRQLWIWGDRLLDGKTTGLGIWEASQNHTDSAIDRIDKDVFISDWHYDRAEPTSIYFSMKGFNVVSCPWRKADVAKRQVEDMYRLRSNCTPQMKDRLQGVMQTVWTSPATFLDEYYGRVPSSGKKEENSGDCFKAMSDEIMKLGSVKL